MKLAEAQFNPPDRPGRYLPKSELNQSGAETFINHPDLAPTVRSDDRAWHIGAHPVSGVTRSDRLDIDLIRITLIHSAPIARSTK